MQGLTVGQLKIFVQTTKRTSDVFHVNFNYNHMLTNFNCIAIVVYVLLLVVDILIKIRRRITLQEPGLSHKLVRVWVMVQAVKNLKMRRASQYGEEECNVLLWQSTGS